MNYFDKEITCSTCGVTKSRFDKTVQQMWLAGDKYDGSPVKRGHIVITDNACFTHAMAQATSHFNTSITRPY